MLIHSKGNSLHLLTPSSTTTPFLPVPLGNHRSILHKIFLSRNKHAEYANYPQWFLAPASGCGPWQWTVRTEDRVPLGVGGAAWQEDYSQLGNHAIQSSHLLSTGKEASEISGDRSEASTCGRYRAAVSCEAAVPPSPHRHWGLSHVLQGTLRTSYQESPINWPALIFITFFI